VRLLKGFERITGCPTREYRSQLLVSALRYRDKTGCLLDEGDAQGKVRKFTRRLWPQTEIAKAWIAQVQAGEQGAADEAAGATLLATTVLGGWCDQFDCDDKLLVEYMPETSFYHVICAITEADRVLS